MRRNGEKLYACEICKLLYKEKVWAEKCQDSCVKYNASLEIASHAISTVEGELWNHSSSITIPIRVNLTTAKEARKNGLRKNDGIILIGQFLLVFRKALEPVLITAIVLACLAGTKRKH